ncbi:MAG: hypothetical protein K8U03_08635 [Planctomycetia bacterium]|nr:hypothetical protein [Planctomycetia bacterium]
MTSQDWALLGLRLYGRVLNFIALYWITVSLISVCAVFGTESAFGLSRFGQAIWVLQVLVPGIIVLGTAIYLHRRAEFVVRLPEPLASGHRRVGLECFVAVVFAYGTWELAISVRALFQEWHRAIAMSELMHESPEVYFTKYPEVETQAIFAGVSFVVSLVCVFAAKPLTGLLFRSPRSAAARSPS